MPSAPAGALDEAAQSVERLGIRPLWAVVVLVITLFVVRAVSWFLTWLVERNARRRLLLMRLEPIIRTIVWAVSIGVVLAYRRSTSSTPDLRSRISRRSESWPWAAWGALVWHAS